MQHATMPDFDVARLSSAVGAAAFAKGFQYAQQRAVMHVEWDPSERELRGLVRGQGGNFYATTVHFTRTIGRPLSPETTDCEPVDFEMAECTCPVEFNCKHAVALVVSATLGFSAAGPGRKPAAPANPGAVGWERSLDSMLLPSGHGAAPAHQGTTPLGLELSLANPPGGAWQVRRGQRAPADPPRLLARLVRPGKNGGWVNGGLSWIKLDSMNYAGEYPEHQVRLLRELYALYRASRSAGA